MRRRHIFHAWGSLLLGTITCGCSTAQPWGATCKSEDLAQIAATTPAQWGRASETTSATATGWLNDFKSPALNRLVEQALQHNQDLRAAGARVRQSRAQAKIAGASSLPEAAVDFGGRRNQSASGQRFVDSGVRNNRFEAGLEVAWELDFWGRVADQRGAAISRSQASVEDLHAARLSLAANTVKGAITLAEAQLQIRLSEDNVSSRKTNLTMLENQVDLGVDSEQVALDVSLARSDLARAEATLASRRREAEDASRNLELLLGSYPSGKEQGIEAQLPPISRPVPSGLPSEMLLRRPDLRAGERRLHAMLQEESATRKAYLPSIRLTGSNGLSTEELSRLLRPEAIVWSVAGSAAQSVYQGGRIRGNAALARARYDEALAAYGSSVQQAFNEVEGTLAAEHFLRDQETALARAATEADRAVDLAIGRYSRGLSDALTVLVARQRAFDAKSSLGTVKAQRLRNRADLHLALGGAF